jgi:hypothetical protein
VDPVAHAVRTAAESRPTRPRWARLRRRRDAAVSALGPASPLRDSRRQLRTLGCVSGCTNIPLGRPAHRTRERTPSTQDDRKSTGMVPPRTRRFAPAAQCEGEDHAEKLCAVVHRAPPSSERSSPRLGRNSPRPRRSYMIQSGHGDPGTRLQGMRPPAVRRQEPRHPRAEGGQDVPRSLVQMRQARSPSVFHGTRDVLGRVRGWPRARATGRSRIVPFVHPRPVSGAGGVGSSTSEGGSRVSIPSATTTRTERGTKRRGLAMWNAVASHRVVE